MLSEDYNDITFGWCPQAKYIEPENCWMKGAMCGRIYSFMNLVSMIMPTPKQEPELYNLAVDPGQTRNVIAQHMEVACDMHSQFMELVAELGIDEDKRQTWLNALDDPRDVLVQFDPQRSFKN